MTIKARFLRMTHIFFVILMLIQLLPDKLQKEVCTSSLIVFAVAAEVVVIIGYQQLKIRARDLVPTKLKHIRQFT